MLALHLISTLETRHAEDPVIWHFCEAVSGSAAATAGKLVRSLILQLVLKDESLIRFLLATKISHKFLFQEEYFETQWTVFEAMTRSNPFETVTCILDGLDECEASSFEAFMKRLVCLFPITDDSDSSSSESLSDNCSHSSSDSSSQGSTPPPCKLRFISTSRRKHPSFLQT